METSTEPRGEEIRVQDLYEGAYLLVRGFKLRDLTVLDGDGRKLVTFVIEGTGIREAEEEYQAGRATANVALLRFTIERLKDRMFRKIREDAARAQMLAAWRGGTRPANGRPCGWGLGAEGTE